MTSPVRIILALLVLTLPAATSAQAPSLHLASAWPEPVSGEVLPGMFAIAFAERVQESGRPIWSDDGRYVVFTSDAATIDGYPNPLGTMNVYVYDTVGGALARVSHSHTDPEVARHRRDAPHQPRPRAADDDGDPPPYRNELVPALHRLR